ncbi:MAG: LysR family transcriptional regulator, partial [Actinomycetia bacterium]|nr:LysR family transcriptional regulator [Actinomycetes bacterium]
MSDIDANNQISYIRGPAESRRWLPALASFDAAARHGSFTAAAEELGVGQPAISHAIRQLEGMLGEALFLRQHRGVELTESGRVLADAVRHGLATIEGGIGELGRRRRATNQTVTIGASTATAAYWLIPRLAQLKLANPDLEVRCITSDTNTFDLDSLDLFIPVGRGRWPSEERWAVAHEVVYPICSADHAATLGPLPLSLP